MSAVAILTYQWKVGYPHSGLNPQPIGEELARIREAEGGCPADRFVELANNPKSPFHYCLTWDDGKAATKCRLQEARSAINCIVSYRDIGDGNIVPVRAFAAYLSFQPLSSFRAFRMICCR